MTWRLAGSLIKLRDQVNAAYPNRSKASDGTIGDAAHAATDSDHNPNAQGVVCAFDITHDPAHGLDIDKLSDALAASRDSRIKYLIANNLILVPADYGWTWQPYQGTDPHTSHLHVSVYGDYDNQADWNIGSKGEETMNITSFKSLYLRYANRYPRQDEIDSQLNKVSIDDLLLYLQNLPEGKQTDADQQLGATAREGKWEEKLAAKSATSDDFEPLGKTVYIKK